MIYLNNAEKTIYRPAAADLTPASEEDVKALAAKVLHVRESEHVYLTGGGTQAMELALKAFAGEGGHLIVSPAEAPDVIELLRKKEEEGARISVLDTDPYQRICCESLENLIEPETKAIVCAHGCSATGNVADLEKLCAIARSHSIPVISDGRSAVGAVEVDLEALGIDVYCFSGEKMLMGPEGIGGVCVRSSDASDRLKEMIGILMEEGKITPPQPFRLRVFAASLQFILEKGVYGISMLPHRLAKRFFESVSSMDPVTVCGDYGTRDRLPLVAITVDGFTAEELRNRLLERDILIGIEKGLARFSFGYFNTRPQVKETVNQLMEILDIYDPYLLP